MKKFPLFYIDKEEFANQIENHDTLPITKSSRGIAAITMAGLQILALVIVTGIKYLTPDFPAGPTDVLLGFIIYAPLIYFVYKGHLWAIVGLGLFYTYDKFYTSIILQSVTGTMNFGAIVYWIMGIGTLWVAYKVERAYRKQRLQVKSLRLP